MSSPLSPQPLYQSQGLGVIRIILGFFLIYHGKEIFQPEVMQEYLQWDNFKGTMGETLVYLGKGSEFVAGLLLFFGLLTRVGSLITIGTMSYIAFGLGGGKIWYEDQHPFMFALLALVFIFNGPGSWSLDNYLFNDNK